MSGDDSLEQRYREKVAAVFKQAKKIVEMHPEIDLMDAVHILNNLELSPAERLGQMLKRNGIFNLTRR